MVFDPPIPLRTCHRLAAMARGAQRLPIAVVVEQLPVAAVRHDVVDHRRRASAPDAPWMARQERGTLLAPLPIVAARGRAAIRLAPAPFVLPVIVAVAGRPVSQGWAAEMTAR